MPFLALAFAEFFHLHDYLILILPHHDLTESGSLFLLGTLALGHQWQCV
jgi:hypothetical protein